MSNGVTKPDLNPAIISEFFNEWPGIHVLVLTPRLRNDALVNVASERDKNMAVAKQNGSVAPKQSVVPS